MVGTLVENAIKHGIGPRASGGIVSLTAKSDGSFVEVAVRDDGVGFRARSGHGVGLGNIRSRLQTGYGASGTLELAANAGGGVTATDPTPVALRKRDAVKRSSRRSPGSIGCGPRSSACWCR
jgi:sensor histidine kinase YesM